MPYKDPERKRQWEREHREERNATRRNQRLAGPNLTPDPILAQEPSTGWKVAAGIGGLALAVGMALLATWGGASGSGPDSPKPRRNSIR